MKNRIKYQKGQKIGTCIYLHDGEDYTSPKGYVQRMAKFICGACGDEFETMVTSVKSGNTKSCGCLHKKMLSDRVTKHGLTGTPIHTIWTNMKARCYNRNTPQYPDYGGRGITVCEKWLDFITFLGDVSKLPHYGEPGYTIEREDNDGNYEPGNVKWATRHVQNANKRKSRRNTSGYVGVHLHAPTGKWVSSIKVNGKHVHLGYFDTREEAVEARNNYIRENNLTEYNIQTI